MFFCPMKQIVFIVRRKLFVNLNKMVEDWILALSPTLKRVGLNAYYIKCINMLSRISTIFIKRKKCGNEISGLI